MYDCSNHILAYHGEDVSLPQSERTAMRARRDANRKRVRKGLEDAGHPKPKEFVSQGSYSMKTMVQDDQKDYDIDDGAYFEKDDLVGPRGAELSSFDARKRVRDAIDDGTFKDKPEVKPNCVRVHYSEGYHVDIPVYRIVEEKHAAGNTMSYVELAASDGWKRSDARDVTGWFEEENESLSPDSTNGRQMRRVTRDLKKLSRSRASWKKPILGGFGITVLVSECFVADADREDVALYETMLAIVNRLKTSLVVNHPVTPNATITSGDSDVAAGFLKERFSEIIKFLKPLHATDCDEEAALKAWDKAFSTKFFSARFKEEEAKKEVSGSRNAGLITTLGASESVRSAVRKDGGGNYA